MLRIFQVLIHSDDVNLVAYIRVSTDKQVKEGFGLDAQRSEIKTWAKREGHRIVQFCSDEGISGSNGISTRLGLYDALDSIRRNGAQGIVFSSLDRLARRMTEQEGILSEVWDHGGTVFSIGDGGEVLQDDPDDPMRTAVRQMRGVFAQLERGLIRQRMAKGKREKAAQGGYVGGAPPLGFAGGGGRLVPDPEGQITVARIEQLHSDGKSLRQIIAVLESEGRHPKRGRWHPSSIARVLDRSTRT